MNLLMTKLNTGECTDIFGAQSGKFDIKAQINVEKNAVDLTKTSWGSQVEPLVADQLSVDGKLYGQPIQDVSSVWAIGYNKQIFKKLNQEIPKIMQVSKKCAIPLRQQELPQSMSVYQMDGIIHYGCLRQVLRLKQQNRESLINGTATRRLSKEMQP